MRKRADPEYHNRIDNWDMYCRMFPDENDRTSEFTYKITDRYTEQDKINGTVRYCAFVKDIAGTIEILDKKLDEYRLESIPDAHYYACNLDQILSTAVMVIKPANGK